MNNALQRLRNEAKELRLNYLQEKNVHKGSVLLKKRSDKMNKVHQLQDKINSLLFIEMQNDNTINQKSDLENDRNNNIQDLCVGNEQDSHFFGNPSFADR